MELSIIIVNYKSLVFLNKCLETLFREASEQKFSKFEVILVNNEKQNLKINFRKTNLKIIENKKNLGFGKACNIGATKAKGRYLLFLNPDTELLNFNFVQLINLFKENKSIGVIGGQLIKTSNEKAQPWTCGKKTSLFQIFFKHLLPKKWLSSKPVYVDWVSGGALITKKKDFKRVGGFDEKFFMYFEDQDFCNKIRKLNKKCLFNPNFKILHHDGQSWQKNKRRQKEIYRQSQKYFFEKNCPFWHYLILKKIRKLLSK